MPVFGKKKPTLSPDALIVKLNKDLHKARRNNQHIKADAITRQILRLTKD